MPTKYITAKDVLQFRDQAFLTYYSNPRYLEMIDRRFGAETVEHIKDMTSHRLERDLIDGKLRVPLTTLPREESPEASPALLQVEMMRKTA